MKLYARWSSHLPVLINLLANTEGDVLEVGAGIFSTPFLHWACFGKRKLVSYENDPKYYGYIKGFQGEGHDVIFLEDWDKADIRKPWDIAFIDHKPPERRKEEVKKLANLAKYVVIHDSEPKQEYEYHYNEIYPLFKYRYDYTKASNYTTVLSNFIDVTKLNI